VAGEEKTNTYEETMNRTASDPDTTATDEKPIATASDGNIETYEVQSVTTKEEESVSTKAREAGRSLKDLMSSVGRKTKEITEEKTRELKAQSIDISAKTDAHDIQYLGDNVEKLITVFEDTMTEIRKEPYNEQESLLVGYRKLLAEQINVISARLSMAKRLKPGA
jgi:hypothetical protein